MMDNDFMREYQKSVDDMAEQILYEIESSASQLNYISDIYRDDIFNTIRKKCNERVDA